MNNLIIKSPEIDNDWYCLGCKSNHNCLSCDVMTYLIKFKEDELKIIKPDYNKSDRKRYCSCWNILKWKHRMCSECYFKARMTWNL